jgi:hypothetical protein
MGDMCAESQKWMQLHIPSNTQRTAMSQPLREGLNYARCNIEAQNRVFTYTSDERPHALQYFHIHMRMDEYKLIALVPPRALVQT